MKDSFAAESARLGESTRITQILAEVCRVTGMGFAAVARVTEERWIAVQVDDRIEFGLEPGDELEIKTTICDEIRECGQAILIDHVGADPEWRTHPVPMLYGFESYASIPLFLADGSFFGTLCAIDPEPRRLKAQEMIATLQAYADEVAGILSGRVLEEADPALRPV